MHQKGFTQILILIGILIIAVFIGVVYFEVKQTQFLVKKPQSVLIKPARESATAAKVTDTLRNLSVEPSEHFGSMGQWNLGTTVPGFNQKIFQSGVSGFYADSELLNKVLKAIENSSEIEAKYTAASGMKFIRPNPGPFVWNLIEPKQGEYHWDLPDLYIKTLRKYNVEPIVTIDYHTEWDGIKCRSLPTDEPDKQSYEHGSFSVFGPHFVGTICNLDDYAKWLEAVVERYDGDGKNDMPGLNGQRLKYWEIFNEIEGQSWYQTKPSLYVEAQKLSYQIIKKHCPNCIVASEGSLDVSGDFREAKPFWDAAYKEGVLNYMDARNWHWNSERENGTKESIYQKAVQAMNDQMSAYGQKKPMWITELGTSTGATSEVSGSVQQNSSISTGTLPPSGGGRCGDNICDAFEKANPNACPQDCGGGGGNTGRQPQQSEQQPNQKQQLPQQSNQQTNSIAQDEEEQAAWYVRRYAYGFANGVTLFTPDIIVAPNNSSLLRETNSGVQARLLFYVHKLLVAKIGKFTTAEELANGQYKFINDGKIVYILWKTSTPLSPQIKGQVKVTDLYGNEKIVDSTQLQLSEIPVFAEATTN